jgi:uncharacterized protein YfiM (DUF2279 family)
MVNMHQCFVAMASMGTVMAASSYATLEVRNAGVPAGQLKNISGSKYDYSGLRLLESLHDIVEIYHSYPPNSNTSDKAIIHLTDIFGIPLLQNKL